MGFFSKLKENFNHGGVKLELQAPDTVSLSDTNFLVKVNMVSAGDRAQTVNSLKVSLVEDRASQTQTGEPNTGSTMDRDVSTAAIDAPFTLSPGESKEFELSVPLNFGKNIAELAGDNAVIAGTAKVLGALQQLSDASSSQDFRYYINAVADVEGIAFDPSDRKSVQVLKPGQIGASWHIGG